MECQCREDTFEPHQAVGRTANGSSKAQSLLGLVEFCGANSSQRPHAVLVALRCRSVGELLVAMPRGAPRVDGRWNNAIRMGSEAVEDVQTSSTASVSGIHSQIPNDKPCGSRNDRNLLLSFVFYYKGQGKGTTVFSLRRADEARGNRSSLQFPDLRCITKHFEALLLYEVHFSTMATNLQ